MNRYQVDDWRFIPSEQDVVALELFLENGQKAIMEAFSLQYSRTGKPAGTEMVVWCELPGEMMTEDNSQARWISRAPDSKCPWSHVELPPALVQQIENHLVPPKPAAAPMSGQSVVGGE